MDINETDLLGDWEAAKRVLKALARAEGADYADVGYLHEALHTASIFMNCVGTYIMEHPAVVNEEKLFRLAWTAHQALFDLYQELGHRLDEASKAEGTLERQ